MAKTKYKKYNFLIPLTVYPFQIMVTINQSNKELQKSLKGLDITDSDVKEAFSEPLTVGTCVMFPHNRIMLRLNEFDVTCNQCKGHLVHEAFHATHFAMNAVGMQLSFENDEAFAYLLGYLVEKIYNVIE